jgi:predicted nucleic acid-binding protein
MSDADRKVYWDTGLFLCFLNKEEEERRRVCEDSLRHAKDGKLIIYTSVWTIVETVQPRKKSIPSSQKLTAQQIIKIQQMFQWDWLRKIQVDERVARKSVEISRDYGLHPADAIHAASAILFKVDALQKWDRDFSKISTLIKVEEPTFLTKQPELPELRANPPDIIGPTPEDF